jgi:coproporphyrinogen III oxidase
MSFCLEVTYRGYPEWPSPQRFDERIEKHLGKTSDGSGFGGVRDITWTYRTEKDVAKAASKARAFIKKQKQSVYRNAKVKTYEY